MNFVHGHEFTDSEKKITHNHRISLKILIIIVRSDKLWFCNYPSPNRFYWKILWTLQFHWFTLRASLHCANLCLYFVFSFSCFASRLIIYFEAEPLKGKMKNKNEEEKKNDSFCASLLWHRFNTYTWTSANERKRKEKREGEWERERDSFAV